MPLPFAVSCFSKIQIGFTFLVPAHLSSPGQRAVKQVCVCVSLYFTCSYFACRGEYLDYAHGEIDKPVARPREWTNQDFNFDNVGISLLSLFTAATFEGWPKSVLDTTWNEFLHSHSLPFPRSHFPFLPTPIPKFKFYFHSHGIPIGLFSFQSHSNTHSRTIKCKWKPSTVEQQKTSYRQETQLSPRGRAMRRIS